MKNAGSFVARRLPDFTLLLYVLAATVGAFSGGAWFALGVVGAAVFVASAWLRDRKIALPQTDLTLLTALFFLVAAALNFQSSQPALSWHEWARLLTVFVPLLFLLNPALEKHAILHKLFAVLPFAILAGGLGLSVWLYHLKGPGEVTPEIGMKLAKYNRGFSYLMLLSFPVMAALWFSKKRWMILPFLLLLLIPAGLTESRSAKLALMAGLAIIFAAHMAPAVVRRLLAASVIMTMGWSFAAREIFLNHPALLARIPPSWRARIEIWDYMSYRIEEKPWLGWGLGTSHTLDFLNPHGAQYVLTTMPAAHPHNVTTQLWVELGLPGLALGIAFAFLTLKKAGAFERRIVPFALGAWAACFCLSLTAYDFWTDSLFAAFAFTALAFVILEKQINARSSMAAPKAPR